MNLSYTIIDSQVLFTPFDFKNDVDPETKKPGIKVYHWLIAFVKRILAGIGLANGIKVANLKENVLYFDEVDFKRWCKRHGSEYVDQEDVVSKIEEIVSHFIQQQKDEFERKIDRQKKIQELALAHLKKMDEICYDGEGRLTTKLIQQHGVFGSLYQGKATLFDRLDAIFQEYVVDPETIFYHGTTQDNAEKIRKVGFDPLAPTLTGTDSGTGTYLTKERDKALNYAKGKEIGLLACSIKPQLKIAHLTSDMRGHFDIFRAQIACYTNQFREAILSDCGPLDLKDMSIDMEFAPKLWDLFIRDFFLRSGYRGLYTESSGSAGCSYMNLFEPQEDIVELR